MLDTRKIGRGSIALMLAAGWATAAQAAVIVNYDFDSGNGSASVPSSGVSATSLDTLSGTPSFSGGAISVTGWSSGNDYHFSVTPAAGYRLDLSSLDFQDDAEKNGPTGWAAAYQIGAGSSTSAGAGSTHSGLTSNQVVFDNVQSSSVTTIKLTGTGAKADPKYWALDNIALNGDVTALAKMSASVTPPAAKALVGTTVNFDLSVSNTATGGTRQEGLDYTAGATGNISGSDSITGLAPGAPQVTSFSVDTSSAGAKSGAVTAASTNAYSTNGNVGQDSFSQIINMDVLDHANASFAADSNQDTLTLDFGTVAQNSAQSLSFQIANLENTAGYTAGLDLISLALSGSGSGQFSSDLATFTALAAGSANNFQVMLDTSAVGTYSARYTLTLGDDQTLLGASGGQQLTLDLSGTVTGVPEPGAGLVLLAAGSLAMLRRRRA